MSPRSSRANLLEQVRLGGCVGLAGGGAIALVLGASSGPMVAFGAVLGLATGLVTGVLLWISAADLPEEPIPPPHTDCVDRR